MKKFSFGFDKKAKDYSTEPLSPKTEVMPKRSLVDIYFPDRDRTWTYYNDRFDLQKGDIVYVEGKLEGKQGHVVNVGYSFKIKLSDYKRVISVVDTKVSGDFYMAYSHLVTFDRGALPYEKVLPWFKAPRSAEGEEEEYVTGGEGDKFPLDDLSKMSITKEIAERGFNYYDSSRVVYISFDKTHGRAIVKGSETYEIEFEYLDGEICNLICSCYCSGCCKHEYAAMLQLKETLKKINESYASEYHDYFAAIYEGSFLSYAVNGRRTGKISLN